MSASMDITDYLARGGKLTSPDNAPPRYRAELLKIMAGFVDSELAGAAGFADVINDGPGIAERIAAARITSEKTEHAGRVLKLMGGFGADISRYEARHPWTARLPRDTAPGARPDHDLRLSVFAYPLHGWTDAVVMNLLQGTAVAVQLEDLARSSYQPLADAIRDIAPREARHAALAADGLSRLRATGTETGILSQSVAYWWPRVAASFGNPSPDRQDMLRRLGLRNAFGDTQRTDWETRASTALAGIGLTPPP